MTPEELAAKAEAELKLTTISYPNWRKKVQAGAYTPPDGSSTHWGKAFGALDTIQDDTPPDPIEPSPGGDYGAEIPDLRMPEPTGTPVDVSTLSQLANAVNGNATRIRITSNISGGELQITRRATDQQPVWIEGGQLSGVRVVVSGARNVGIRNVKSVGPYEGYKFQSGAQRIKLDRVIVDDAENQGLLIAELCSFIQVWNSQFLRCGLRGSEPANQRHAFYLGHVSDFVGANILCKDMQAYAFQVYPGPNQRVLLTGIEATGGVTRGGMIAEGSELTVVGYVCQGAASDALTYYGGQVKLYDSVEGGNGGGFGTGYTKQNAISSGSPQTAKKGLVQPARYGLLAPRPNPDAGYVPGLMAINPTAIWSYAGVSVREDEGGWADANRMRFLKYHGWGYVAVLLGDGRTEQNRQHADNIVREARRNGMGVVGWFTPRPTSGVPVAETVAMAADCVSRYGIDGVRYQTEAEFEYSNDSMGGTPGQRFDAMAELGAAHRNLMGTKPAAVYARVGLNLADAWWAKAWQYQMRCFVECYGPAEGGTHPGWASIAAPGSANPPLVGGWWYRVRLGPSQVHMGRLNDDGRHVTVEGQGEFRVGSPAGPRMIPNFGNPKWGALLGFFPTSWIKWVGPSYIGATGTRPTGETLAGEVRQFQQLVRKFGASSQGFSIYVGPEMTDDHFARLSPTVLPGVALLP